MLRRREYWLTAAEAAEMLTRQSGHKIRPDYLRVLAQHNKIATRPLDGKKMGYRYSDVRAYKVTKLGEKRGPRTSDPDGLPKPRKNRQKKEETDAQSAVTASQTREAGGVLA